jgi:hypothetical protein
MGMHRATSPFVAGKYARKEEIKQGQLSDGRRSAVSADDHIVTPGPTQNTVRAANGKALTVPEGWVRLPPGDAALTRRVKAAGDHWIVQEKRGRKVFSRGVRAPAATIERIRADLDAGNLPWASSSLQRGSWHGGGKSASPLLPTGSPRLASASHAEASTTIKPKTNPTSRQRIDDFFQGSPSPDLLGSSLGDGD